MKNISNTPPCNLILVVFSIQDITAQFDDSQYCAFSVPHINL